MLDLVLVTDSRPLGAGARAELDPLLGAFSRRGVRARLGAWDDPAFDWPSVGLAVLRTTWNYHQNYDAFLAWLRRAPRLLNPPEIVAWNAHKTYLRDLAARGIETVPTEWVERECLLDELLERRGWDEAVLKPAVANGSWRTQRFRRGEAPQALLIEILSAGMAMLQPYFPSVETTRERSLVFFDDKLSHAVKRYAPLSTGLHGGELVAADPDELGLARRVLATQPPLPYARVDLVRDPRGRPCLMELELIEPSFFLDLAPAAADRFADAVLR